MSDAGTIPTSAALPDVPSTVVPEHRRRRGLFRKYMVALVGLVAVALFINAGVEFWFSYRENKATLLSLQQEKADAAAQRIEEFITGIERQIGWTTLPLWGAAPLEQRRFDFVRLLRQVPAITELQQLDGDGKEQLSVSRLSLDVVGSGADFSHSPEFVEARAHGIWLGPVYFRKQSEPYLTLTMAGAGNKAGVTVASINLKLIWDVITSLKIGEAGYAYVVDDRGKLVADPDISLVLRDTDFSKLPQVAAALVSGSSVGAPTITVVDSYDGRPVLSAHTLIKPLNWRVFVEVPLREAYAPLYLLALRNALWLALALVGAILAALLLARRMTGPIRALQEGAARLGAGELERRITINSSDELESLADQFNNMAEDLQKSYAELEQRVLDRTAELSEALEQQTATAEVLRVINSSPGDLVPVFDAILEKAYRLCGATRGTLFLFDGKTFRAAAMRGYPPPAEGMPPRAINLAEDPRLTALHAGERLIRIPDLSKVDDPIARAGAKRGGVHTNLLLPLRKDSVLLGVISCERRGVQPFPEKEIALLENFAAQAVIAIENARLLDEIRQTQTELRVTFDNMADGVAMFDQALNLAAWNRNFQEMLDLPEELLTKRPGFDAYIRYLTQRGEFGERDPESEIARLRSRLVDHYSFERTRPDGTVMEVRHNPMPDGGVVLIYSDISERKRSEAEIRAARDTAEAAYRDLKAAQASLVQAEKMASLGQLTAGIAHEIKNPLNFVNNFASLSNELLEELKAEAEPALITLDADKRAGIDETLVMLSGNLEKIVEHGQRADNIVKSMLEHSRGVSGERREVDLNGVIEEALNLAYHGARAQDQSFNITLKRDYAEGLKPIEVAPQEITRVFLNLFGNGFYAANRRARDNGDGSFRPVLMVQTREVGDAVEVKVRDNGTGIPPEIKDKLFQPFFTTKPTGEGTGLGLSISYDIVTQQHGGTISVESEPGAFTEFTVRLPRR